MSFSTSQVLISELIFQLDRLGQPEEVADVVAFLLSDKASYIHGSVISIDDGSAAL